MSENSIALIFVFPLFGAVFCALAGRKSRNLCHPIAVASLAGALWGGIETFRRVIASEANEVSYFFGGWNAGDYPRGVGIEFRADYLGTLIMLVVVGVAFLVALYSKLPVAEETPEKEGPFYTLFLLQVTGLAGICLTGDAFNLYVLIEVAALTGYGLIAMGSARAAAATFNYVILGTIGASFYLLGVGYVYMKTGTLNMVGIQEVITANGLADSAAMQVAFVFICLGVLIKMAFFPFHAWLPNAYFHAPTATSCLLAPLVTKVMIYVMIRMTLTVFGVDFSFENTLWTEIIPWLVVLAIVCAATMALAQRDIKKMLTYLIVAEVGYMVGGVWVYNYYGFIGSIFHIISDACMTLCLFLGVGIILRKRKTTHFDGLRGLFRKMPFTMAGFFVGGFSIIGLPPTCGFFSKWYLITGGMLAGRWEYMAALMFSTMVMVVLFFRLIERIHLAVTESGENIGHGHGDLALPESETFFDEGPLSMLIPLLLSAAAVLLIGIFNQDIVDLIQDFLEPFNLPKGTGR
ncbi:MAG: proton-conducting transporter membrane subunit [Verrucomicrobia bacterium]|nr:proton-conducting transporter membrane subunit [Verrucomicrobiota bacterium]MDA1048244.1 proton-conducting transporter membrane subunit [Verrucomicrobiota bacterium]